MSAEDLPNYTDLAISSILQRQSIPIKADPNLILTALDKVFGSLRKVNTAEHSARFRLFDAIDMIFERTFLVLEWSSSPINDFYADTLLSEVLKTEIEWAKSGAASADQKTSGGQIKLAKASLRENVESALTDMLGEEIRFEDRKMEDEQDEQLLVNVDASRAVIRVDLATGAVRSDEDKQLEQVVGNVVSQLKNF